jgi:hypothetical protein
MSKFEASYPTPRFGLATSFNESEVPPEYALKMRNRFINAAGGLEKRQGIQSLGDAVTGSPDLYGVHELVDNKGNVTLMVSSKGTIYKYDGVSAYTTAYNGWDTDSIIRSVQVNDKHIFFNGVDRQVFTEDASAFSELQAIIERGELAGAVSAGGSDDADVSDWVLTDVNTGDIIKNLTQGGMGAITAVTTANVTHTTIGSAATGLGKQTGDNIGGDRYEIVDTLALNIIPTPGEDDNTAVGGPNTTATVIDVSGVNFLDTDIKVGDFIRNTTRAAVAQVSAVATALTVTSVKSQTTDDALVFLKSAMPIAKDVHVHYGRTYYLDARDLKSIRISGKDNPEDMTTSFGTLDASTFSFGSQQPEGDVVKSMTSFQRFFTVGGKQNVYMFSGTDPIADTTAASTAFDIIGLFPQGTLSTDSMISLGNDAAFVSFDGVQSVSMLSDSSTLGRANLSEAIKITLRELAQETGEDDIQLIHYPRRSWLIVKMGQQLYIFNYTSQLGVDKTKSGQVSRLDPGEGSWSLFDGKMARQNGFFVRQNGDLLAVGATGGVYTCDTDGVYADDGESYSTEYQTGWLSISSKKAHNTKVKQGNYIKPVFDVGANITYNIKAEGDFDLSSGETITVGASGGSRGISLDTIPFTIGGTNIQNQKHQLRWRGEHLRLSYTTEDALGPDTISRHTIYGSQWGVR